MKLPLNSQNIYEKNRLIHQKEIIFGNSEFEGYESMSFIIFKTQRLNKAEACLNLGKKQVALKLVLPLVKSKKADIAYRANRVSGLALYKQKKYDECVEFLEQACRLGNYRHDWYNLAMALALAGKFDKAEESFKNIYRTNVQSGYMYTLPVPGMLFQYMKALKQKEFIEGAIARANELKQMYIGVGKSDPGKQVQRGLPSFPTFRKEIESLFQPEKLLVWENEIPN